MSSSLQNERYKILFILSTVAILLSTIKTGSTTDLVDLPLSIPSRSVNINATLTDTNAGTKYFIQESISASGSSIRGKIVISGEKDSYNIHYNTDSSLNKERLVMHGTNCLPFTYKNNWDQTLPGIKKPVTNLILLIGPSILYRFDHSSLVWKAVKDKNIRGTMMRGAFNARIFSFSKPEHFDDDYGIKHPSRIEFSVVDPYSSSSSYNENLILDIYLQNENHIDEFANEVHVLRAEVAIVPLPGIGCPHYLSTDGPSIPKLKTDYIHYTMYEYIKGSTTSRTFSEIYASGKHDLLKLKSNVLGVTTEVIYDYQLGVSFLLQEGGSCSMLFADLNSPGIDSDGYFHLDNLFLFDSIFNYLGKLNLQMMIGWTQIKCEVDNTEHRPGFTVNAWEATRYNVTINRNKADKAVITQYFAESKKTYTFTDGITRDYLNFEKAELEDEFHDIFTIKDCKYLSSDKKVTLAFKLHNKGNNVSSQKFTESHLYELKQSFVYLVISREKISPLRIDTIEYNFNDAQLEVEVTFLDSPNFQYIFNVKTMSVSADTLKKMQTIKANNENECLNELSKYPDRIRVVIYRQSDSSCGYLEDFDDLKEDTKIGEPCSVYHFPLHNLRRIYQEVPLDKIHNAFLLYAGQHYSLLDLNLERFGFYKLIDVIDKTKNQDTSTGGFQSKIRGEVKLRSNHQDTVIVSDAKTLADCYRTCHNSEQLKCNTFSFCLNGDCRVSSLLTEDSFNESYVEQDRTCFIYALNALNDYLEVPQRKFKTQTSIAVDKSVDSCAEYCHASPDCFSFQWCDNQCISFGGFYTDASTEYDEKCSLYLPKVSEKYQKTGNKIVSDVLYTEINLNFEQCASLCHGWSDGDTGCKSFNYCPKSRTESSCSLTQFSVKSSNTKTTEGGDCSNYELKGESNKKKRKESSSTDVLKGTSGSDAFGIIMLFLFVGALLGFAAPFGYAKAKQMRSASEANESFTWKKQVDSQAENDI
uniref:Apple domain-containing protein n=1 Tax=Tetranychus urticae TaxID=32264 RepID=T1KP59_TETUR